MAGLSFWGIRVEIIPKCISVDAKRNINLLRVHLLDLGVAAAAKSLCCPVVEQGRIGLFQNASSAGPWRLWLSGRSLRLRLSAGVLRF